jgi:hypothetical protein
MSTFILPWCNFVEYRGRRVCKLISATAGEIPFTHALTPCENLSLSAKPERMKDSTLIQITHGVCSAFCWISANASIQEKSLYLTRRKTLFYVE